MTTDTDWDFTVEGSNAAGYIGGLVPDVIAALSRDQLGSREEVETEIDAMCAATRDFYRMEPDEVMRAISGFSARCTELEIQLYRAEGRYREFSKIRTMQVRVLLAELDRQFKIHSRTVELRRQDLEVLRVTN